MELEWQETARCRGVDPEQFFVRGSAQSRKAVRLCGRCPVKDPCLQYAIDNHIDYGIWGGLTERQRRAFVRRMAS